MWIPTTAWWSRPGLGRRSGAGAQRFIRHHQLEGKQTYGPLSCGLEGKSAVEPLVAELRPRHQMPASHYRRRRMKP